MDYFKTTGCCTSFPSVFFTSRFLQNFNFADNRLHPAVPLGTLKFSHILFVRIACLYRRGLGAIPTRSVRGVRLASLWSMRATRMTVIRRWSCDHCSALCVRGLLPWGLL